MVFSSVTFLFFFLPICLGGYYLIGRRLRNGWLLLSSLVFYTWGGGALVLLLVISTVVDFAMGWIVGTGVRTNRRTLVRFGVAGSVLVNLGLLSYFKYANFFVEQLNSLGFGDIAWTSVVLPIGISFFTFQSMSYTIDVSRGRVEHLRNILDFGLYVTLFPQLVAGPIVRFHEISDQLQDRVLSIERFASGAARFAHGLAKKVLIADAVAPIADAAFAAEAAGLGPAGAWLGVAAYTVQIYFDFSGYSDMAIGLGTMLGFDFPENFRRPYSAVSITDFWRRWHITLSNWFRDYVYIPLGGSRGSSVRTMANLWTVFVLAGIWHGANWTFLLWGVYHGGWLVAERLTGQRSVDGEVRWAPLRRAITLLAVMVGWVVFRSPNATFAWEYLGAMFTLGGITPEAVTAAIDTRAIVAMGLGVASVFLPGNLVGGLLVTGWRGVRGAAVRIAEVAVALPYVMIVVASGSFSPFLYYQF
ncbi:MAG: MBOAT family protein [Acidimicrobiia bacterium]|nr:MBOAT family protein [Acidimicrobiia bacterium]